MKRTYYQLAIALFFLPLFAHAGQLPPQKEYYSILVYHLKDAEQESRLDAYLKDAFLPAVHKAGIAKAGVFKPIDNDTSADRRVYVFLPGRSVEQLLRLPQQLLTNSTYVTAGKDYIDAAWDKPVYIRMETIILDAFPGMPKWEVPALNSPKSERIYELRNYESASEKLHQNKVDMFNEGDEIGLFKRLNFNASFYGEVIAGGKMPNLMYMTCHENKTVRDANWKSFVDDPYWKKLSAMPEYQHNVSHIDISFLYPTEYSDY